ncbi:plasmid replication protein RepC [Pseudooceanicola nanhaiensis]|uniref:plasmid replication protein RepC n=1 Tax=Pseudooceanicola nanhaiensis TaxID=375761 RepID=UPI001CD47A14|nr:plasmid replication protein RepC [Pseudooceanicola nanhaiensis]MCA0922931.1 replication initiator RepC [Pseudooceanicola nanhaiensis]
MTQHSTRFVGQPVVAASDGAVTSHDKWRLLDDLTRAAEAYGLSHRAITVLRSMLSFIPERSLSPLPGRAIVFASNATLSERLGGMPESTLRRHLAALVASGVIARQDSPNRKRFARRRGDSLALAFGFDLAPLAARAGEIARNAGAARARAEEHATLRCAVLAARHALFDRLAMLGIDPEDASVSPLLARTRLMLRRKDNHDELRALLAEYETAASTIEMTASNSENERHQHRETNNTSEETCEATTSDESNAPLTESARPEDLSAQFQEYRRLFPEGAHSWTTLREQARQIIPMMGVDLQVYDEAERYLGRQIAPIAVLCMLERFETLTNPGGFLRHLARQGRAGSVDLRRLLASAAIIVS